MILELMQHAATVAIVIALVVGLPLLRMANGHSRILAGVMVIVLSAGLARFGTVTGNGYLQAVGALGISLTALGLVLSPIIRRPR